MSILDLNDPQLNKIAKKVGIDIQNLKKLSSALIEDSHNSVNNMNNSSKMQNSTDFYKIRLRSRQTQLDLNKSFIK